jgi:hypothetical protein
VCTRLNNRVGTAAPTLLTAGGVATTVEDRARAIKVANDATLSKTTAL